MQLYILLSILFVGAKAFRFEQIITKARRATSLSYTPLIRLETPSSASIQSEEEDQPKPFSFGNTNIFAPFQKNVRSKARDSVNDGMNAIDRLTEIASPVVPKASQKV